MVGAVELMCRDQRLNVFLCGRKMIVGIQYVSLQSCLCSEILYCQHSQIYSYSEPLSEAIVPSHVASHCTFLFVSTQDRHRSKNRVDKFLLQGHLHLTTLFDGSLETLHLIYSFNRTPPSGCFVWGRRCLAKFKMHVAISIWKKEHKWASTVSHPYHDLKWLALVVPPLRSLAFLFL